MFLNSVVQLTVCNGNFHNATNSLRGTDNVTCLRPPDLPSYCQVVLLLTLSRQLGAPEFI